MMKEIFICIIAGFGAGASTGFSGLSAAVFIAPILITALGVPAYEAIGISLASDILASAVSAYTYKQHGNIELKKASGLMGAVFAFAIIGSIAAYFVTDDEFGNKLFGTWMLLAEIAVGLRFLIFPVTGEKDPLTVKKSSPLLLVICGIGIGFLCGFQGTGGGMLLLIALTSFGRYGFKQAVGTSVFIMTFTALIGAASHFIINGWPDMSMLVTCIISTFVFARLAANTANRITVKQLNLITGWLLLGTGILLAIFENI